MSQPDRRVFINAPFDEDYRPCFEAILFTIALSGYIPVCALAEDDFGDVRLDKLKTMIERCDLSVHDLSRTEANEEGLPRFNMPFELGLTIGAKRYGGKRQRRKRTLVMVKERFEMPKFMSDVAGNDPAAHDGDSAKVIKIVRNYLGYWYGTEARLPGAAAFVTLYNEFVKDLDDMARKAQVTMDELNPFDGGYHDLMATIGLFIEITRAAAKA